MLKLFSAYARQFLSKLDRPDVDKITGLSPVIPTEQNSQQITKIHGRNNNRDI